MILPIVNNNGTSGHELLQQQINVLRTLRAARDAICDAAPHGRDFQLNQPHDYYTARSEHSDRVIRLDSLIAEYTQLAEHFA